MELSFTSLSSTTYYKGRIEQKNLSTRKTRSFVPVRHLAAASYLESQKNVSTVNGKKTTMSSRLLSLSIKPQAPTPTPGNKKCKRNDTQEDSDASKPSARRKSSDNQQSTICSSNSDETLVDKKDIMWSSTSDYVGRRTPRSAKKPARYSEALGYANEIENDDVYSSSSSSDDDSDSEGSSYGEVTKEEELDSDQEDFTTSQSDFEDMKDVKFRPQTQRPRNNHFKAPLLQCIVCDRRIVSRSNNRTSRCMHVLTHAKMHYSKKQFKCSACSYMSNNHMQRHIANVHKGRAKAQDLMTDNLRAAYRDMAIRCFPSMRESLENWYNGSSKQSGAVLKGGRQARNTIRLYPNGVQPLCPRIQAHLDALPP